MLPAASFQQLNLQPWPPRRCMPAAGAAAKPPLLPLTAALGDKGGVQLLGLVDGGPLLIQAQLPDIQLPVLAAGRQQRAALAAARAAAARKLQVEGSSAAGRSEPAKHC